MNSPHHLIPSPETFVSLIARSDLLTPPKDYYISGAGYFKDPLPENLICFTRKTPKDLYRSGARFHHHRWVLLTSLYGEGRVYIDDVQTYIAAGESLLIKPFQFHSYSDVTEDFHWLFISFEIEDDDSTPGLPHTYKLDRVDVELLNECLRSWQQAGLQHLSPLYLALLLKRLEVRPDSKVAPRHPTPDSELLLQVNQVILKKPDVAYSLKELAAMLGISESHLRARFRRAAGVSIGKHIRDLRMRHACRLLHSTKQTVSEIATACGFENVFAFSRAFRSAMGESPTEYRRRFA